jgi:hypothetical protein
MNNESDTAWTPDKMTVRNCTDSRENEVTESYLDR